MRRSMEVLSPAGDMERLTMDIAYGADAVYLAGELFGMRAFAGNFGASQLEKAVELCHASGVKVYVTCNTLPRNGEVSKLPGFMELLQAIGVDAVIVADMGVFAIAKKYAPKVAVHVSTQAGIVNYATAATFYDMGASRAILARELSLEDIREIRAKTPASLELEAFVHGSMCVSFSGRCLLSEYLAGRDANRGACAQPCRWKYALMEETRPGEYFPIDEDSKGTYIMNSKDMCMIDYIPELMDAGIDSIKIEGRTKSAYYAAVTTGAYRNAVDCAMQGVAMNEMWRQEVEKASHREYCTGFYFGAPGQHTQDSQYIRSWQVVAMVKQCDEEGNATLSLLNKFSAGDILEVVGPGAAAISFQVPVMEDEQGKELLEPKNPQMVFKMKLPRSVPPLSYLRIKR